MGDPWTGMPAASADYQRYSARHTVSPFNGVDEQITDAIILLNRLPNAIERQARDEYIWSSWSAQKAQRSQAWVRIHEPELMRRADTLAMFMGMGIDPKDDAKLRELLQPFEVPEGVFDGIELSLTGVSFQKGYEPMRREPARQEPARQEPARQEPARQEPTRQEPDIRTPGSKRKQPDNFEDEVMRPQYESSSQHDFERRQAAGPKRVRQDTSDDWEPSSSKGHLWPERPAVGPRLRPVEIVEAGVREYEYQIPSGFASGRPVHGSGPRPDGYFEGGRLDYGSRAQGEAAATRPTLSFGSWSENVLNNGLPTYESRLQSDFADEEPALNPEHRQHDVSENDMRPPFGSSPTGSWFRVDDIHEGGVPGYGYQGQYEFSSTGQALGFEPRQPVPSGNERNNLRLSGEMVGPKRRSQAPPKTPQQETSGAAKFLPVRRAKGEKWEKKKTIDNCPVVVPNVQGFVELRCDKCHCNASAATSSFWKGIRGMQSHLRKIHKETTNPAEIFARCSVRSVSAEEVKQIESGELVIGKLFHKTVKDNTQGEGAAGRAQREGGGEKEVGEEQEAEARPVRIRRVTVRDNSKGKLKNTTW